MGILEIIEQKRDGKELSKEQLSYFVDAYTKGDIPDYQASALLMAIYINGLSDAETGFLTSSME